MSGIRQRKAATVPEHWAWTGKDRPALTDALNKPIDGIRREWPAAFSGEYKRAIEKLPA